MMTAKEGYSAALILSEGRYEKRMRHMEFPPIEIAENKKSVLIRTASPLIVKRLAALKPLNEN